mmetsp:Transcript_9525/g.35320  ORF Transcript_9525/g.35320 Transcript_9525/m.35320 type:complete len:499 (-) Transcript_9525:431-1927(-)|eukprot:CAMPEP_0117434770 /NCGR_PEP_ID=MMETSP0759-20121206/123_1 /TAXON_ID=63605 /ORGANISM="Percolomonas cosmopolitus, Strain WS" /LENGTH=498 /DNA_ID=CAMNT_0005226269 /DNA_START=182 /DNA_END=1678 /DNA_ORIENTATION=+
MFFSEFVLTKKGPLAKIWLAAHLDKKLTKAQITETDIVESVESISQPVIPIALRTSGHLLLGVVKIYRRKVKYVLNECNETMTRIKLQVVPQTKVDLPEKSNLATLAQITMPDRLTELDLMLPDVDLQVLTSGAQVHTAHFRQLVDDLDEWYTEETPREGESPGIYTQTQRPYSETSSLDGARRQTTPRDVVDLPPLDFPDLMGVTPSTRPGKTPPTTGEAPMMSEPPMDFDMGFEPPPPMEEEQRVPVPTAALVTRKRKRAVIQDEPAEISNDQFKDSILRQTTDIKRRRHNAPTEQIGTAPLPNTATKNVFNLPASFDFMPEGLSGFFTDGLKGHGVASEVSSRLGEEAREEEFGALPDLPPAFDDMPPAFETPYSEGPFAPESAKITPALRMQLPQAVEESRVAELEDQLRTHLSEQGLSQQSITFVAILMSAFEKDDQIKILELIGDSSSKLTAAQIFYQVLVLKTHGYIATEQTEAFGEITVTKTARFEEIAV